MLVRSILDDAYEGDEADASTFKLSAFDPKDIENPKFLSVDVDHPETDESLAMIGERLDDTLHRRFLEAGIEEVEVYSDPEVFLGRRGEEVTEEVVERLVRAGVTEMEVYSSTAFISVRGSYEDLTMRRDWSQQPTLAADVVDPKTGEVLA
jgi:hypothetical protein